MAERAGQTAAADTRKSSRKLKPQGSHPETPARKAGRHSAPSAPPEQPESHQKPVRMLKGNKTDPKAPPKKIGINAGFLPGAQRPVATPLRGSASAPRAASIDSGTASSPATTLSSKGAASADAPEAGQARQLAQLKANIAFAVQRDDFESAAVLKKQLEALSTTRALGVDAGQGQQYAQTEALQVRREVIENLIQACADRKDCTRAASLHEQLHVLLAVQAKTQESMQRRLKLKEEISACAVKEDYDTAAALKKELEALKKAPQPDIDI